MSKELNFETFLDTYNDVFPEYLSKIAYIVDAGIPRELTTDELKAPSTT